MEKTLAASPANARVLHRLGTLEKQTAAVAHETMHKGQLAKIDTLTQHVGHVPLSPKAKEFELVPAAYREKVAARVGNVEILTEGLVDLSRKAGNSGVKLVNTLYDYAKKHPGSTLTWILAGYAVVDPEGASKLVGEILERAETFTEGVVHEATKNEQTLVENTLKHVDTMVEHNVNALGESPYVRNVLVVGGILLLFVFVPSARRFVGLVLSTPFNILNRKLESSGGKSPTLPREKPLNRDRKNMSTHDANVIKEKLRRRNA